MKQVSWNRKVYETFCDLALLSQLEKDILLTRIRDNLTISQQAKLFNVSESTIKRKIATLKKKYDEVQKLAPRKLPPRKKSVIEAYMDNN